MSRYTLRIKSLIESIKKEIKEMASENAKESLLN